MNNKGFAISTMLYGLSIVGLLLTILMVQTMSASRSEQKNLSDAIKEDLSSFSVMSEYFIYDDYKSNSGKTKYKLPVTGWYRIELWTSGAVIDESTSTSTQNYANAETISNGGNYSSQTLYLEGGTTLNIFLGTTTKRETKICNTAAECTCGTTGHEDSHCMATSYQRFKGRGTFTDELDEFIRNNLSSDGTGYKKKTVYYGYYMNINERGKARISLVSTLKGNKYDPLQNSGNALSGTYYIIDAKFGKALGFGRIAVDASGNPISSKQKESVEFSTLTGDDTQKWKFNPQDHSFVNVRTNYSLRTQTPVQDRQYLLSKDFYSSRDYEKWVLTNVTENSTTVAETVGGQAVNNVKMLDGNGNYLDSRRITLTKGSTYYLYHNREQLPGVELSDADEELYQKEQIAITTSSPSNKYRSYKFYVINAY